MSFGDRLIKTRKEHGYTREALAQELGISKFTLRNYELEATEPGHTFLKLISDFFNVSVDYLMELTDEKEVLHTFRLRSSEQDIVEKYRTLDSHGKDMVDTVLKKEAERMAELENESTAAITPMRVISYYQRIASAGNGQVIFTDMPVDRVEIPDKPEYKRVSYAIGVNGNSMEPIYYDGDILLVEPTYDILEGEIGIFIVGNEAFVKKLGKEELISLNKGYDNIPLTEDSKCMGRVVDKLTI